MILGGCPAVFSCNTNYSLLIFTRHISVSVNFVCATSTRGAGIG